MGRIGIFALNPKMVPVGDQGKLPLQTAALARAAIASSEGHLETMIAESESVNAAETQPVKSLGDLPLTVISHGQLDASAVPPSLSPEIRDEYEQAWQELQKEITALSTRGRRLVAERSGHNVIFDQPEIVVESIFEMVRCVNNEPELAR